jgi:protein gp37
MQGTRQHTHQVLTKRPARLQACMQRPPADLRGSDVPWPPPNAWLGVSVKDQRRADHRIPLLLDTPVAIRFLSCKPL